MLFGDVLIIDRFQIWRRHHAECGSPPIAASPLRAFAGALLEALDRGDILYLIDPFAPWRQERRVVKQVGLCRKRKTKPFSRFLLPLVFRTCLTTQFNR